MAEEDDMLLPSSMDISEYEDKIFRQGPGGGPAPTVARGKTIDDVLYLFGKHQGVVGVMLMNKAGKIISSNFEGPVTGMYCGIAKQILDVMTPSINSATPKPPQINIIRINSCSQEVVIAPVAGEDLIFVIIQNPEDHASIASCTKGGEPVGAQESRLLRGQLATTPSASSPSKHLKLDGAPTKK